jgi:heme/copper-type cytochrome/quinol oxidase subunit 2
MTSRLSRSSLALALIVSLWLLGTANTHACATCFGATDSPLGEGLNWGIFALLIVVNSVIGGICAFFFYIARRAARIQAEEESSSVIPAPGVLTASKTI